MAAKILVSLWKSGDDEAKANLALLLANTYGAPFSDTAPMVKILNCLCEFGAADVATEMIVQLRLFPEMGTPVEKIIYAMDSVAAAKVLSDPRMSIESVGSLFNTLYVQNPRSMNEDYDDMSGHRKIIEIFNGMCALNRTGTAIKIFGEFQKLNAVGAEDILNDKRLSASEHELESLKNYSSALDKLGRKTDMFDAMIVFIFLGIMYGMNASLTLSIILLVTNLSFGICVLIIAIAFISVAIGTTWFGICSSWPNCANKEIDEKTKALNDEISEKYGR
jgi:hypothetical protein